MGQGLAPAVRVAEFGVVVTLRFCQTCIFSSKKMAYNVIRLSNRFKGGTFYFYSEKEIRCGCH